MKIRKVKPILQGAALVLFLLFMPLGCVTEVQNNMGPAYLQNMKLYSDQEAVDFEPLLTRYNLDPPLKLDLAGLDQDEPDLFKPFHKYSHNRYLGDDGSISLHYYLEVGTGAMAAALLVEQVPGLKKIDHKTPLQKNQVTVYENFIHDRRQTAEVIKIKNSFHQIGASNRATLDLLVAKVDENKILEVEDFLAQYLTEIPQIEIKVKVIEVALTDSLEYGVDSAIWKETSGNSFLNAELDEDGNYVSGGFTTKFNTESLIVSGIEDYQGSLFHVAGVHDKLALDAWLEVVQRTSDSQILTAPEIKVLNGHKAMIETGVDIPIRDVVTKPNTTEFTYKSKPTGVKLIIVPTLLMDNTLLIEVNGEVVTLAGEETEETPTGTVQIPIFTTRSISDVVRVKEGEAFAMGGLLARSEIERVSKVPIIGDIPILGHLFKGKSTELRKTQIIFYIEPHIVRPGETLYIPDDE